MDKAKYSSAKYIGMDIHKETISIAVMNAAGKFVMECVIEIKASTVLQFIHGLHGDLQPLSETNCRCYTLWRKVGSPHMISRRWRYPEDFRRMAVERFKCCENIEWLAKELGVSRQTL